LAVQQHTPDVGRACAVPRGLDMLLSGASSMGLGGLLRLGHMTLRLHATGGSACSAGCCPAGC
jgi:hypothetical protein